MSDEIDGSAKSTLKLLADRINASKKEMERLAREEGEKTIKETFSNLFKAHPIITKVWWKQYTDYFNDGESCYFSVHELSFSTSKDPEDQTNDYDEDGWDLYSAKYKLKDSDISSEMRAAISELVEINAILQSMDNTLEICFGDHAEVIVTPAGINIEDYSDHN